MKRALVVSLLVIWLVHPGSALADNPQAVSQDLSSLEVEFFEHDYADESVDKRLSRLEELVFGATKTGSVQDRLTKLLLAVPTPSASSVPAEDDSNTENAAGGDGSINSDTTKADAENGGQNEQIASRQPVDPDLPQADNGGDNGFVVPASDYYPTVTALEERILGKTYRNLPVEQRLAQLETKAFGKPSSLDDLSKRVERLKKYAAKKYGKDEAYLTAPAPAITWSQHPQGLEEQIGLIEDQVFGRVYSRDDLISRLNRLEDSVFPNQPIETFMPIPNRIARLEHALGDKQALAPAPYPYPYRQSAADQNPQTPYREQYPMAYNPVYSPYNRAYQTYQPWPSSTNSMPTDMNYPGAGNYPEGGSFASPNAQTPLLNSASSQQDANSNTSQAQQPKAHPFLHKLGTFLGAVGTMAASNVGSMGLPF